MTRASSLHRLQQVDLRLDKARSRLAAIESILSTSPVIASLRQALAYAEDELKHATMATKKAEHAVEALRERIGETDKKLYGGSVRNPKELQDLQQEAEALRRQLSGLEDQLLETMVSLEERELTYQAAQQELQQTQEAESIEHAALRKEHEALTKELHRLEVDREGAICSISEADARFYERLQSEMGTMVVATLDSGSCNVCGLTLSSSEQQAVRIGDDLKRCVQCGRILYSS